MWQVLAALAIGSAVSGIAGGLQQKEAAKQQKRAQRQQTAIQIEQNKKEAIQTLRRSRILRAQTQMLASNTDAIGSGSAGSYASNITQTGVSLGGQKVESQAAMNTSDFLAKASQAQGKADAWGAAQSMFDKGFGYAQQFGVG